MTFDVEVLLKGTDAVVTETVTHEAETSGWADTDVREVLLATLRGVRTGKRRRHRRG